MKIVIDMNLSPAWVAVLEQDGHHPIHWSSIGSPSAKDSEIMRWALEEGYIVFTHDLDFGHILAATAADSPSVLQIRTQDPTPEHCSSIVLTALTRQSSALKSGALVSLDMKRERMRLLPLARDE